MLLYDSIRTAWVTESQDNEIYNLLLSDFSFSILNLCRRRIVCADPLRLGKVVQQWDGNKFSRLEERRVFERALAVVGQHYYFISASLHGFETHSGVNTSASTVMGSNLTFQNLSQNVDENKTTDGANTISYFKRGDMHDVAISYSNIVKKSYPVAKFIWQTSDADGDLLFAGALPMDLLLNCQLRQPFNNMTLWRGKLRVRLHINSSQFHQGLIWMGYVPGVTLTRAQALYGPTVPKVRTLWSNLPGGYCNAFKPTDIILDVPFTHPRDFAFTLQNGITNIEGCVGSLIVGVFNQLKTAGTSSQRVDCTLFVDFPDSEFYLPVGKDTCTDLSIMRTFETHGGTSSTEKHVVINYNGVNNSNIGTELQGDELDATSTNETSAEAAYGVAMDNPFIGTNPFPAVRKICGFFNNKANIQFLDKLTNNGKEQAPTRYQHFSRRVDEMTIPFILSTSSFQGEVLWQTTDIADATLLSGLITPSPCCLVRPAGLLNAYQQALTPMDYLSGQFRFWSGPINLHVKVLASAFQTGLLRIAAVYGDYSTTLSAASTNCQWAAYIDLKDACRDYNFSFEFPSTVPYLMTTTQATADLSTMDRIRTCVGSWYIHVVNPLIVGTGVSNEVSLMLFWSAPHMNYYFLKPSSVVPSTFAGPGPMPVAEEEIIAPDTFDLEDHSFETHMETENEQKTQAGPGIVIGTKAYVPPIRGTNTLPTVSLRDMIKRYVPISFTSTGSTAIVPSTLMNSSSVVAQANQLWTWGCMYVARRGGLRWKILRPQTEATMLYVTWNPKGNVYRALTVDQGGQLFANASQTRTPVHEVETSFTTEFNYLINQYYADAGSSIFLSEGSLNISDHAGADLNVWMAGADDFRFGLFVGPPLCAILNDPLPA